MTCWRCAVFIWLRVLVGVNPRILRASSRLTGSASSWLPHSSTADGYESTRVCCACVGFEFSWTTVFSETKTDQLKGLAWKMD